jgi:hypothetical protein
MRKNLEKDEPDNSWTDREIFYWMIKTGVVDEAHSIGGKNQQLQKSSNPSKSN